LNIVNIRHNIDIKKSK